MGDAVTHAMPKTVGELRGYAVEIRCRRCGHVAPVEPEKMTTKDGRAIDRNMPLANFLAKLTCAEKACGAKPEHLYASARTPGAPGDASRPLHHWCDECARPLDLSRHPRPRLTCR